MTALWLIVLCGLLAIVYGIWAIWSVMQADPGSAKMQEISAAVRETEVFNFDKKALIVSIFARLERAGRG